MPDIYVAPPSRRSERNDPILDELSIPLTLSSGNSADKRELTRLLAEEAQRRIEEELARKAEEDRRAAEKARCDLEAARTQAVQDAASTTSSSSRLSPDQQQEAVNQAITQARTELAKSEAAGAVFPGAGSINPQSVVAAAQENIAENLARARAEARPSALERSLREMAQSLTPVELRALLSSQVTNAPRVERDELRRIAESLGVPLDSSESG